MAISTMRASLRPFIFILGAFSEYTAAETYIYGSRHDHAPFEYLDTHGSPAGFNIDLIRAVAREAGFDLQIRLGPWHEIRKSLEIDGDVHISDMFYSRIRAKVVDFATPNLLVHDEIFTNSRTNDDCHFDNLQNKRVLVQRDAFMDDYLRSHQTGAEVISVDSEPEALQHLMQGKGDCAVVSSIVGHYTIHKLGMNSIASNYNPLLPREYSFVVMKGNHQLLERLNQGLASVKQSGEYTALYNVWFNNLRAIDQNIYNRYAAWGIALALLFTLFTLAWVRTLRHTVGARTRELRDELVQRTRAEQDLRESDARFRQLADNLDDVFWIATPSTDKMLYVSPAYETIWGRSCESLYNNPTDFLEAVHPEDRDRIRASIENINVGHYNEEYRILRPDGSMRWVSDRGYPLIDEQGQSYRVVGITQDITERKLAESRIEQLATRDPLTSLPNRHLLYDRLEQGIVHAKRNQERLAVIFLDLDNFKTINDSLGHNTGDALLCEVGRRIAECLRLEDTLSRLGGDEFVIVLKGLAHSAEAAPVAHKILAAIAKPLLVDGYMLNTSCSIGISLFPDDGLDSAALMRNADTAMYHAKAKGRNNLQFFSQEMNARVVERLTLEVDLRQALEKGQFCVYYQPKINLSSGKITGAEALLRWQHPERGLLGPHVFIAVAEETGLIIPIGRWVMETAIQQARLWSDQGLHISMAVNVSARQLSNDLAAETASLLQRYQLPGRLLELEITESVLMEQIEDNINLLHQLHALGIRISIDDFGTGYSSLSYLKRFRIHALKIDRAFVHDIESDSGSLAIVKAIISLAKTLGLHTVAEGVETLNQLNVLRALEVDEYQGFLACQPEPAEHFVTHLQTDQHPPKPVA